MGNFKGIRSSDFFMLAENRFMNSRSFYEEHKEEIKKNVIIPLRALASDVNEYMLTVDGEMYINPVQQVSRVFRDTRRTRDKTLYRENLWVSFSRYKKEYELYPSFWFEMFQNGYTYGVGYFYSPPALMEAYRREILENTEKFSKIIKSLEKRGFTTYGEVYKKPKSGDVPENIAYYYNKKNIGFLNGGEGIDEIESADFSEELIEKFMILAPMYKFLLAASERYRKESEQSAL